MPEANVARINRHSAETPFHRKTGARMRILSALDFARTQPAEFGNDVHQAALQADGARLDQRQKACLDDELGHRSEIKERVGGNRHRLIIRINPAPGILPDCLSPVHYANAQRRKCPRQMTFQESFERRVFGETSHQISTVSLPVGMVSPQIASTAASNDGLLSPFVQIIVSAPAISPASYGLRAQTRITLRARSQMNCAD